MLNCNIDFQCLWIRLKWVINNIIIICRKRGTISICNSRHGIWATNLTVFFFIISLYPNKIRQYIDTASWKFACCNEQWNYITFIWLIKRYAVDYGLHNVNKANERTYDIIMLRRVQTKNINIVVDNRKAISNHGLIYSFIHSTFKISGNLQSRYKNMTLLEFKTF